MELTAILLAGERPGTSPVAQAAGVCCKALAPVAGRPMLARVLATLAGSPHIAACQVVGNPEFRPALEPVLADFSGFARWRDGAISPARSAALAAAEIAADRGILLTTADHPLLTAAMIDQLCSGPQARRADAVAGLVRHAAVMTRYPDARCTPLRFADDAYCGTNLFLFPTPRGRGLLTAWQRVETARKTPWRVVGILGPLAVLGYLTGRLSLPRALRMLSRRMAMELAVQLLDDPRAALDVDTPGDWELACRLAAAEAGTQR